MTKNGSDKEKITTRSRSFMGLPMRLLLLLLLLALPLPLLSSCGKNAAEEGSDSVYSSAGSSAAVSSGAVSPETPDALTTPDLTIRMQFESSDGKTVLSEEGKGSVTLEPGVLYKAKDKITVTLGEGQHYLAVNLCDKMGEAILYLPEGEFVYKIPSDGKNYLPSAFYNAVNTIKARIPTEEELRSSRNLALNPYDITASKSSVFPHAFSNNQYNYAEFGAHNVLDGCTKNSSHGNYPYQSWGTAQTVKATDFLLIDFGREIEADSLTLYLRADFASNHDAYFSSVTVEFSNGSSIVISPERKGAGQSFSLGSVKTSSLKLTGFVTDTSKGIWAGYTEVEVYGQEASAS